MMGHWTYRVIHHDQAAVPRFGLHEVCFDDAGKIVGWTQEPARFSGDSTVGLEHTLRWALTGLNKPVLKLSELREPPDDAG